MFFPLLFLLFIYSPDATLFSIKKYFSSLFFFFFLAHRVYVVPLGFGGTRLLYLLDFASL